MLDFKIASLIVVIAVCVLMTVTILIRQRHHPANLAFAVFGVGVALWSAAMALFQYATDLYWGSVFTLFIYIGGMIIVLPFYFFAANFPEPLPTAQQRHLETWLLIYGIIWFIITCIPGLTFQGVVYPDNHIVTGPGFIFYSISVSIFVVGGLLHLIRKRQQSQGTERRQLNIIIFGSALSALFGLTFNVIMPLIGYYNLIWLGPNHMLILVALMAYAMIKHNLFNVRVIATELFVALVAVVLLIQVLVSETVGIFLGRLALLILYGYIARQLIKSVYQEIRVSEEQKKLNKELQRLNGELHRLLDVKNDYIHAASHQLRTPLTGIRGMLMMEYEGDYDNVSPEERKKVQKTILTAVERLAHIVDELLKAARLEYGMQGEKIWGDIEPLVEQSLQVLQMNYHKKGLTLNYQAPSEALPQVLMLPDYLQQVFLNLIDNAERYTPVPGQVTIHLYQKEHQVIFEIQDTGIGLTPEDKEKLFQRFARSEQAKAAQPNGTGLGLYIVQRIVEEHGGAITAESSGLNQGTLFRVTLPCRQTT